VLERFYQNQASDHGAKTDCDLAFRSRCLGRHSLLFTLLLALLFSLLLPNQPALAQESELSGFEAQVRTWMELEKTRSDELRSWTEEKEILEHQKELLATEQTVLTQKMREVQTRLSSSQTLQAELELKRQQQEKDFAVALPRIAAAEARLLQFRDQIPQGLRESNLQAFYLLEGSERLPLTTRLSNVLKATAVMEELQKGIHRFPAIADSEDGKLKLDVIFLGLAQGFAVTPDGTMGASITLKQTEGEAPTWDWAWSEELGPKIRRFIESTDGKSAPKAETLPIEVGP